MKLQDKAANVAGGVRGTGRARRCSLRRPVGIAVSP